MKDQGMFHGDKKSRDLHEKSCDLSSDEIFQHKILKSQFFFKKRAVHWYFYATLNTGATIPLEKPLKIADYPSKNLSKSTIMCFARIQKMR